MIASDLSSTIDWCSVLRMEAGSVCGASAKRPRVESPMLAEVASGAAFHVTCKRNRPNHQVRKYLK